MRFGGKMHDRVKNKVMVCIDVAKVEQYGVRTGGDAHGEVSAPDGDTGVS
jgi:hypothetical protein